MLRNPEPREERLGSHAREISDRFGTPVLVFYERDLIESYDTLRAALDDHYPKSTVHVAVKANFQPSILETFAERGAHAEAFAHGETIAAKRAGFDPEDILLTGMAGNASHAGELLRDGASRVLVDNMAELEVIDELAADVDGQVDVLLRINPTLEVPTHPHIATGTEESKFGLAVSSEAAERAVSEVVESPDLRYLGLHCHIGSQIESPTPYAEAATSLLSFADTVERTTGERTRVLDLGGGFPIGYGSEVPPVERFVETIGDTLTEQCREYGMELPELYLEPGRYLLGSAATFLGTVQTVKETPVKRFAVLDAGTNTVLLRQELPVLTPYVDAPQTEYDVVGPLCHSHDVFREQVSIPELSPGDLVGIDKVGAYTIGRETHMNAMPKPPIVMVRQSGAYELLRERESCSDVIPERVERTGCHHS